MLLRLEQSLLVEYVELDVVAVHREVAPDQAREVLKTCIACDGAWSELLVQKCSARGAVVHLGAALDDCGRAVCICELLRRDSLRYRLLCKSAVCSSSDDLTEVDVACSRQHVYVILSAAHGRSAGYFIPVQFENRLHDVVRVVVIISVLRSLVLHHVEDGFVSEEIVVHGLDELLHGEVLLIVYVVLDGCEAVCDRADSNALDVPGVVSRAAIVIVLALADAVVGNDRQARCRHVVCVELLDNVVAAHLHIYHVVELLCKCIKEFFICVEVPCISGLRSELLAGLVVESVIKSKLKDLRDVEVSCQDVSLIAPASCLYAS